jgi:protein O-mannosyl-transferase
MDAHEFIRRFLASINEEDSRFAFFLGAGCSMSSGIPGAASLVRAWLPRLRRLQTGLDDEDIEQWAESEFTGYDHARAGAFYGAVIEQLFHTPQQRQNEIERLTKGRDPGFGYAVLAQLTSHHDYGPHCNVVLTTNFDDLVADALYLYTNQKPLVITHDSLVGFLRMTRTRPVVLKLHGDARLAPRNTRLETSRLDDEVAHSVTSLLTEMGIVFVGYGGNDKSIIRILSGLPPTALPWGAYWVSADEPPSDMCTFLETRNGAWVKQGDFDQLMLLIRSETGLNHPDRTRFESIWRSYEDTFKKLTQNVHSILDTAEKEDLQRAVGDAARELGTWWPIYAEALEYESSDPERADTIFQEGIQAVPDSPELMGMYANFLADRRKEYKKADQYYRRALDLDPGDPTNLGNYAIFLNNELKDHDRANEYYRLALASDPDDANNLGAYASFLSNVRRDYNQADEYFRRALEADPEDANNLGNYAGFLSEYRGDYDTAEEYYRRAIRMDSEHANNLGAYGTFLTYRRREYDKAEEYYVRALEANPGHAVTLGSYANFLAHQRKDYVKADQYYRLALEAQSDDANNLGNYAGFLLGQGRREEGLAVLDSAWRHIDDGVPESLTVELRFYGFAHRRSEEERSREHDQLNALLHEGHRSPGWSLDRNVEQALDEGHPQPEVLRQLAHVITAES